MNMKSRIIGLILLSALFITGCSLFSGFSSHPPTAAERLVYDVHTNIIDVAVLHTNVVIVTNIDNQVVTNVIVQSVTTSQPQYELTTKTATTGVVQGAGAAINVIAPGVGSIVSAGILLLLAIWGHWRGYKNGGASVSLAQEIEALREFIKGLPSGAKYDTAITGWLQSHQLETGVANQVLSIVQNSVDNPTAKQAAADIQATLTTMSKP